MVSVVTTGPGRSWVTCWGEVVENDVCYHLHPVWPHDPGAEFEGWKVVRSKYDTDEHEELAFIKGRHHQSFRDARQWRDDYLRGGAARERALRRVE